MSKIVIDPGHGKKNGKELRPKHSGICETDVVWHAAIQLRDLLVEQKHDVILTKDSRDEAPDVRDRGTFAVEQKAEIFVSLHCNAADNSDRRGVFGIFYGKDPKDNWRPDAEIKAPKGRRLARFISQEISALTELPLGGVDGAKLWWQHPDNLGVLTGGGNWAKTDAACLIEAGFLTNDIDRQIIGHDDGPKKYALGCARGIHRYLGLSIPEAWQRDSDLDLATDLEPGEEPAEDDAAQLDAAMAWARSLDLLNLDNPDKPVTTADLVLAMYRALG